MPTLLPKPPPKRINEFFFQALKNEVRPPPPMFKFMTVTLSPRLYKEPAPKQFKMTAKVLISMLQEYTSDYCTVTELTESGNVHYHFWATFDTNIERLKLITRLKSVSYFGFMMESKTNPNKSTIQQQEDTYEYMTKSLRDTYTIIRSRSIVFAYQNAPPEFVNEMIDTECIDI